MFLAIVGALALQSGESDLVVDLCNETPVVVAYSVNFPAASGSEIQRGWFNVPPGDCLEGRIGATSGGQALIHVRSGSWVWPVEENGPRQSTRCVPPASHEMAARTPPCGNTMREVSHVRVGLEAYGRQYRLSYSVSCSDLGEDASLCRSARPDRDGFAQVVRETRLCNVTDKPVLVAELASPPRSSARVETWHRVEAGQCRAAFRDMRSPGQYYFLTPLIDIEGGELFAAGSDAFCVAPTEGLPESDARRASGLSCPEGTLPYILRTAEFGRQTSLFEITVN